ncbi:uracil-DNA glycosylase [Gleimia coleocanis DSM 15436]|uniref:Uracil-DNA glycosylase n=1 Tax=Gleimia coleocanis DSM 15436 TaxID=525245 RepID=C0VYJ1_9ACTO|nr:uracil-DNA glycosylase [Gleimia coleocanis]EEH64494.1 uracil-DNA glycosylase [Gleimia coleocanis DSM 15436]
MTWFLNLTALDPQWQTVFSPHQDALNALEKELETRVGEGAEILPAREQILRCFTYPLQNVKVLIVGQDPYPTPGNAVGLSFSVPPEVQLPASLRNIFKELSDDIRISPVEGELDLGLPANPNMPLRSGDLTDWAQQGVCLLNRVLTVEAGKPKSHNKLGWQTITEAAITALVERNKPLVVVLWGKDAQELKPLIPTSPEILVLESAHPSPLSARRGFFGSKPFSQANQHLEAWGLSPINWL